METLVLYLCGIWFWLTRKFRVDSYNEAAEALKAARRYLARDFAGRASTRDRGQLLPEQLEAIAILDRHSAIASRTSRRFESLGECCRFVIEELTGAPPRPAPVVISARNAFTQASVRTAMASLLPDTRTGALYIAPAQLAAAASEPANLPEAA